MPSPSVKTGWSGCSKRARPTGGWSTWANRLNWGRENLERMIAAAEDPLNRVELWRSAKDPWQFLQTARAIAAYLQDPSAPIGAPVRLDQTASGPGILAALIGDPVLARQCNLIGSTPNDLYEIVLERVINRVLWDLHNSPDPKTRGLAEGWMERRITRKLIKPTVVAMPFGGSYASAVNRLTDHVDELLGYVPIDEYVLRVFLPAKYLAGILNAETKAHLEPLLEPRRWMMKVVRRLMKAGHEATWISPMGFPVVINDRGMLRYQVKSQLNGNKITVYMQDGDRESALDPVAANKGIGANLIHSFDAAFCQSVIWRLGQLPLLTNHDCFATTANHATTLHSQLHLLFREFYMTDWLAEIHNQYWVRTGLKLPAPPRVSALSPSLIGTNPYLFS